MYDGHFSHFLRSLRRIIWILKRDKGQVKLALSYFKILSHILTGEMGELKTLIKLVTRIDPQTFRRESDLLKNRLGRCTGVHFRCSPIVNTWPKRAAKFRDRNYTALRCSICLPLYHTFFIKETSDFNYVRYSREGVSEGWGWVGLR